MNVQEVQEELQREQLDGWLFFDHHQRDPLAYRILGIPAPPHVSRRWYYLIPTQGTPRKLVHKIEPAMLDALPGEKQSYSSWKEQVDGLQKLLRGVRRVAMQYSPYCEIPYVSLVDGGTLELVKRSGPEVVSAAELIQHFEARLDQQGMETHLEAGRRVDKVRWEAFAYIGESLRNGSVLDEFTVQQFVMRRFNEEGLFANTAPIVGVNKNAGNPHYEPPSTGSAPIQKGDFLLLDMWAKLNQEDAVYYDITWTAYCGEIVPEKIQNVFEVVTAARDKATSFVENSFRNNRKICGYQVDDAARQHIISQGFGANFIHRTGHSIGREVHGNGANMDNFEVHDERKLIPWTCFSVEPGIYLSDFGVRAEVNMFIDQHRAFVTGEIQSELVRID